jgi:hypothetical protein
MPHVDGFDDGVGYGVWGVSSKGTGVRAESIENDAVTGFSKHGNGVWGYTISPRAKNQGLGGVVGFGGNGYGVYGLSAKGTGLYGHSQKGQFAADLNGNVRVTGNLQKAGGSFKIDHPLDPAGKYLSHSFVESPDMKNIYDGVVVLDEKGEAKIELPDWFGALNKDFRYQLTAIGTPGPKLYVLEEISDATTNYSRFKIAGGNSGMKVSWQVTGIRKDPWANAHRIQVEEDKPNSERGYYMYPDLYDQPAEKGINRSLFPKGMEELLINANKRSSGKIPPRLQARQSRKKKSYKL